MAASSDARVGSDRGARNRFLIKLTVLGGKLAHVLGRKGSLLVCPGLLLPPTWSTRPLNVHGP